MRLLLYTLLLPLALSHPLRYLVGRPPTIDLNPRSVTTPSPTPSPAYDPVFAGPFIRLDSRIPISSCPQLSTEYLQVVQTQSQHLRIPHSKILTNGNACGSLPENATTTQLLTDSYMELIPLEHLLTEDIADQHSVLGAYQKLNSKRAYSFRFFKYMLDDLHTGYIGFERYKPRKCGDIVLPVQSLIFFGTVGEAPVNMTPLIPRLQQGPIKKDVRLQRGRVFHVTISPNGSDVEHVCPSVLRTTAILPIPDARQCFPSGMTVISSRGIIDVADVEIGDELYDGVEYSQVILFTHRDDSAISEFKQLVLENGSMVQASMGHYLLSAKGMVKAGEVGVDDWLYTDEGLRRVISVSVVTERGLYNMHTASGVVVVGGVVATCYTSAVEPFVAHALLAPVRFSFAAWRIGKLLKGRFVGRRGVVTFDSLMRLVS